MKIIVTLKLKGDGPYSKADVYSKFGLLAEFIAKDGDFDVEDVTISGDEPALPVVAAQPPKVRKPRGPNKPKTQETNGATPPAQQSGDDIPAFLDRRSA